MSRSFLVDHIDFPVSPEDAMRFGFDIDEDGYRIDNAMRGVFSVIALLDGGDVEAAADESIAAGTLLHLLTVQAPDLESSSSAKLSLRQGVDLDGDPTDNFSGTEMFGVDPSRDQGELDGRIVRGRLLGSGGRLPIVLAMSGVEGVAELTLEAAHIDATIGTDGMEGRIGGAIAYDQIVESFIPFAAGALQLTVVRDCPNGVCEPGSFGKDLLDYIDEDGDGRISAEDLLMSELVMNLLTPDVDIFDGETGEVSIHADGIEDALSIGFGFTAVAARIDQGGR